MPRKMVEQLVPCKEILYYPAQLHLVLRRKSRPSSSFSDSLGVLYLPSETQKPSFFALLPLLLQLSFPFPPIFSLIRRGVSLPSLSPVEN